MDRAGPRSKRRARKPLDETGLRDLALSYVARFATSGAKLEAYLARKIRERGVQSDEEREGDAEGNAGRIESDGAESGTLNVRALVEQFIDLGYVDDAAYAKSKARDLMARGYGSRRVDQALYAAGIDQELRENETPSEAAALRAAILQARKRRFGPFDRSEEPQRLDPKRREKQVAAMLRAGHDFAVVRRIIDAENEEDLEQWLAEAEAEERSDGDHSEW
ncbi:MAG: regulatory protein RecX [Erythrobacter sp.]